MRKIIGWALGLFSLGLAFLVVALLATPHRNQPTLAVAMVGYTNILPGLEHVVFEVHNGTRHSLLRRSSIAVQVQLDDRGSFENRPYTNLPSRVLRPGQQELLSMIAPTSATPWRLSVSVERHHNALERPVAILAEFLEDLPLMKQWDEKLNSVVGVQSKWIGPAKTGIASAPKDGPARSAGNPNASQDGI